MRYTRKLWDACYRDGFTPWDTGKLHVSLKQTIKRYTIKPSRILEIGCGTGNLSRWLARLNFKVTAIDISSVAIKLAMQANTRYSTNPIAFKTANIVTAKHIGSYPLIIDCAVFNTLRTIGERKKYAKAVAKHLNHKGLWISLIPSIDRQDQISQSISGFKPPGLSAAEIITAVEPHFELIELKQVNFEIFVNNKIVAFLAFNTVFKKRERP